MEAPMLGVGLMSGTSLDGTDAVLVRISGPLSLEVLGHASRSYSPEERRLILDVLAGGPVSAAAKLHASLAHWACDAVEELLGSTGCSADQLSFIAFHGQTIWHEPPIVTWQLGDSTILAERFGVKVVHDFRSRDVAAGGQGAPLVPVVDALCFGAADHPRILLNLGGMANATWVERRGVVETALAGDSGPGMAVIDALARIADPTLPFDRDGVLAAAGQVNETVLRELLEEPFFAKKLPKSTGRELFGDDYAVRLAARLPGADGVRTAVALTVESVVDFCVNHLPAAPEVVAAGGGCRHPLLMSALRQRLAERGMALLLFDEIFFAAEAKEGAAFAMLGWLALHGQPGNLPAVTGAAGPRVIGAITPA